MSRQQVNGSPIILGSKKKTEDATHAFYRLQDGRALLVSYTGDTVTQLEAYGYFTTPEGITNRSGLGQIQQIYGMPDQYYDYQPKNVSSGLLLTLIAMPLFGLLTGVIVRIVRPHLPRAASLLLLPLLGAVGMAVGFLASGTSFLSTGFAGDVHSMVWRNLARGALAGASVVLVMELLSPLLSGRLRSVITLVAMVFVAQNASLLAGVLMTHQSETASKPLMVFTGPFVVMLFIAAGARQESQ